MESSASGVSFWALNADGSGLTRLVVGAHAVYGPLWTNPSPRGGLVTYVDETGPDIPRLRLISLRDRTVTTLTSLMPAEFAWPSFDVRDIEDIQRLEAAMQTYAAVTRSAGVWSRDGRRLAFVAAIDGPSSDLYLYSTVTREITRLTDGPTEAASPIWSPDERYILHGAATDLNYNRSGAGYAMTGIWAARPDGSGAHLVYPLSYRGFDRVLGWISRTVFLVDSWEFPLGYTNLRTVDIESGEVKTIWAAGYAERAFDPNTETVLFMRCDEDSDAGVYWLPVGVGAPRPVPGVEPDCAYYDPGVTWSAEAGFFFVETGAGVVPVTPQGEVLDVGAPMKFFPSVSARGGLWALPGDGISVGTPEDGFRKVTDWNAYAIWRPDGEALFLFRPQPSEDGLYELYLAQSPEFLPILIARDLLPGSTTTWVPP